MKSIVRSGLCAALLLAPLTAAWAMKNEDVVKMTKAGLAESTILLAIGNEPAEYDTSPNALIELKNTGVSEAVIQKMLAAAQNTKGAAKDTAAPTPAPAAAAEEMSGPAVNNDNVPSVAPPFVDVVVGQNYFLRCSIRVERGNYVMTNYARGDVVPVNTPVKLVSIGGDKLFLKRLDNGTEFSIENMPKFTMKSPQQVGRIMLSAEKAALEKLPVDLQNAIRSGEMRRGMTKEQVLMARGYPPAHETPSVENDRWVYWSSRFVKQTIVFSGDRLVQGRSIR